MKKFIVVLVMLFLSGIQKVYKIKIKKGIIQRYDDNYNENILFKIENLKRSIDEMHLDFRQEEVIIKQEELIKETGLIK